MITSFEVAAVLDAKDNISPVLLRIAARFRDVEKIIDNLERKLASFGTAFEPATAKAEAMARGVQMAMGQIDTAITATTANIKRMADEMTAVAGAAWKANAAGMRAEAGMAAGAAGGRAGRAAPSRPAGAWTDWQGSRPVFAYPAVSLAAHREAEIARLEEEEAAIAQGAGVAEGVVQGWWRQGGPRHRAALRAAGIPYGDEGGWFRGGGGGGSGRVFGGG